MNILNMVCTLSFFLFKMQVFPPIILMYLVPVLFTFYILGVQKLKKKIPAPKGLINLLAPELFF